jgi:hypothetical protein
MTRCCLCRQRGALGIELKPTALPGSGGRCRDAIACRQRVRDIVAAHQGLAEVCR